MNDPGTLMSLHYCKKRFMCYATFAHLPVYISIIAMDLDDRPYNFHYACTSHHWSDHCKAEMESYIRKFDFDDRNFFPIDDYQLFLPMCGPTPPLSDEQIEQDRQELLAEVANPRFMVKHHAESMLRAVEYWKLRYNTTYQDWKNKFDRAMGYYGPTTPDPADIDEGYSSD